MLFDSACLIDRVTASQTVLSAAGFVEHDPEEFI
jgi:hypothetical protein